MRDAGTAVERQLAHAVQLRGGGREDLADPVGRELDEGGLGRLGQALPPPAGEVRDDDVGAQVKLGLEQDPPAAGPAPAALKGAVELTAQDRRGVGMARRRPGKTYSVPSMISAR